MPAPGQATTPLSVYRLSSPFLRNPHLDMTSAVRSGRGFHTDSEKMPKLRVNDFCSVNWLRNYGCMLLKLDVTCVGPLTIIVVRRHSENIGSAPSLSLSRASERAGKKFAGFAAKFSTLHLSPLSLSPSALPSPIRSALRPPSFTRSAGRQTH